MTEGHSPTTGPARLNTSVAHNARVWNYWIGGKDNYEVDQRVAEHVASMFPVIREVARADRDFLARAVRFLATERGMRQFLDVGTGLPTVDNTHEIAQRIAPESRIVYVDNDPIVLVHARSLLTSSPEGVTDYVDADVHDPESIVQRAGQTLDLTRPVAVMMLGILNFVLDTAEARDIVQRLMAAVPSGSHLVLTHPTYDGDMGGEGNVEAMEFWNANATPPITARSREEIAAFLDGLELVEPGLVPCSQWRAESPSAAPVPQFGAVAVKP
ncbi:translation initiation factor IF-2 [Streptomyces pluripotens]|uniref:Translation initiation factor IF-2 n=1 Tax=Streptomyces pluripotens TaxID=1355015 RepID=A0A221P5M4_9ACTN|nr:MULTISPECIES: SAM-dependent methyltransferase [Streptomyces]ARP73310.1 translation initiation factor IF-2 [Streptomyces pluripotens]ASN27559.1 translation initiation factor IF-2 [Streptomyces pluripotens]KIE23269.1 translation initiation factor IF-2 [Streptomyces sp. MUSC 125]MCH0560816.1 SAM-dependent methyltransferase [Streptomyces sp. MUM 16J]